MSPEEIEAGLDFSFRMGFCAGLCVGAIVGAYFWAFVQWRGRIIENRCRVALGLEPKS